jgi:hypothetical protein
VERCYPEYEIITFQIYITRVCEVCKWNKHWYFIHLVHLQFDAKNSCLFNFDIFELVYLSCLFSNLNLDDWLTVHHNITLVDLQLDAQNSYLFNFDLFCIGISVLLV